MVHHVARFTQRPEHSHALAINYILHYLKNTKNMGMILRPNVDFKLSCCVDSDFGALFRSENPEDPVSVKSRTGYLIKFGCVPILWVLKL